MSDETKTLERFLAKVEREDDHAGCWLWTASTNEAPKNYGRFRIGPELLMAHRVAYEAFVGPIPDGLTIDHLCRTPRCVNPFHLEPVTLQENIARGTQGWQQRAKTHCPRGHRYDEGNTYVNPRGQRLCRACGRERMRARRATA